MYSLIVLGLIPGTQIQITFAMWLIAIASFISLLVLVYIRRKHFVAYLLVALQLRQTIRHLQLA
jgi:hypothetical protein